MIKLSPRVRFFNFFRGFLKLRPAESLLRTFTNGKDYTSFFARCLPQNYQYAQGTFRIAEQNGIRFRLDISQYMEWVIYFGLKVENRDTLYPLIKKGMHVLDIGTNIGETLLNFARLTGESGSVTGFEPVSYNYEKCRQNIRLNSYRNARVMQLALSDRNEWLSFEDSDNFNSGGIYMQRDTGKTGNRVKAMPLDDFIRENAIAKVDFIKMDVEGFEMNVLKGAKKTIEQFHPVLYIEVDDANLRRQGSSAAELEFFLKEMNYNFTKAGKDDDTAHYDLVATAVS